MQRIMARAARSALLMGLACAGLPFFGALLWLSTRPDLIDEWLAQPLGIRALHLAGLLLAMMLIGGTVATVVAGRATESIDRKSVG